MSSPNEILDLSRFPPGQEIARSKALDPGSLLTLRRFCFAVNRCHALCFSVPLVEQKKHESQGEQTVGIEGLTSCDLLTWWEMG